MTTDKLKVSSKKSPAATSGETYGRKQVDKEKVERQHGQGKLLAYERIDRLVDKGTFVEFGTHVTHQCNDFGAEAQRVEGDSVVTGLGKIDGREICLFAQDFTVFGGSLSLVAGRKIAMLLDHAAKIGAPVIGINDSGGARIQEGVDSLAGYGNIFVRNVALSGVVPQITVIAGPTAGGAVYSPAINDFIFMVNNIGKMYITGPNVVKAVMGEETTHEDLGGSDTHTTLSGVAQFAVGSENECFGQIRRLLSFIPSNNKELPPISEVKDDPKRVVDKLRTIIPKDPGTPYDMKEIILAVVDDGDVMEVQEQFAPNILVGFARMDGRPVGIVANQPLESAGMLDINASVKAARFIRFCDAFNIPLVTFVDVPGFMPGIDQEQNGIIRHGAKLIYAYSEATVPKITVVIRKAYGGAYIVMNSKELGADLNLAWPSAEIAVMGPEGAIDIIKRKDIATSADSNKRRAELITEYRERFANPRFSANRGYIDDIIDPADTRRILIRSLDAFANKVPRNRLDKKHGNIPL